MYKSLTFCLAALAATIAVSSSFADVHHIDGIKAPIQTEGSASKIDPTFDIVHAKISVNNNIATFHMAVAAEAGTNKPESIGQLGGSNVYSYVWPTSMDSAIVGFDSKAGILALAVTSHPDFDDTPLYDENADNDLGNDGALWHSHWVVLEPNESCGKGALGVVDIPEGSTPNLPKTWPGLPMLLDSPGWDPVFKGETVEVRIPFSNMDAIKAASYDGVTAGLRVNQSVHAPLLCVVNVMDVASGDLSLPGKVSQ
tara:strand:- start:418 stop:1182 length:765 start_codon:yes stop_codon:yes gene_type:complete